MISGLPIKKRMILGESSPVSFRKISPAFQDFCRTFSAGPGEIIGRCSKANPVRGALYHGLGAEERRFVKAKTPPGDRDHDQQENDLYHHRA